jgi:hypothetical protein
MVKSCVLFAVQTEFLNVIQASFGFKGLMEYYFKREQRFQEDKEEQSTLFLLYLKSSLAWLGG